MRMKFNKSTQFVLVSALCLAVATLMTACGSLTVDFVYVASAKAAGSYSYGEINAFEVNRESGALKQIPSSPFPSEGRNPVALAASSDYNSLYVVNEDDNTVVQFLIGSDAKLYPENTINTPGYSPMAVSVTGSYLYVVDTYQPLANCSTTTPCSGAIAVYPLLSGSGSALSTSVSGRFGTVVSQNSLAYVPLKLASSSDVMQPTAITSVTSGSATYVYVTAYDTTSGGGYVFAYTSNSGVLTAVTGSPFAVGTQPSAVSADASGNYLYVADYTDGMVRSYAINSGALTYTSKTAAGGHPSAIVLSSANAYAYVSNALDSTISIYTVSNGVLTKKGTSSDTASSNTVATGSKPVGMILDPSRQSFLYTADYLGGEVTGFVISSASSTEGIPVPAVSSPYTSNAEPTAIVAVPFPRTASK